MSSRISTTKLNILSTLTLSLLAFAAPAQSTVLHGYLEQQSAAAKTDAACGAENINLANSYPATYQGSWHCITTVVDSGVPTILVGQVMASDVNFNKSNDGRVTATWTQPGWTESQASVTTFSNSDARVDRTNYYVADGMDKSWAARSRDQFSQTAADAIVAKSYVDQYIDGQFVGRYRTTSVLHKQAGGNIAFAQK